MRIRSPAPSYSSDILSRWFWSPYLDLKNSRNVKALFKFSRVCLFIIIGIALALTSHSDNINRSEIDTAVGNESFSIFWWEVKHLPLKWTHLIWESFPGNKPTDEERIEILEKYIDTVNKLSFEKDRLNTLMNTAQLQDELS